MHDTLISFGLLATTTVALLAIRKRIIAVQIGGELLLLGALGGYLLMHGTTPLPRGSGLPAGLAGAWLRGFAILWWLIAARLVVNLTLIARRRDPHAREARLFSDLVAAIIYLTAILIVLNSVLELPINGLLATSGVVAIVLGLALQNTLADVFSGIAVGLEKPFHAGDRVSLGETEGVIVRINWRSVTIQTDTEDLATIPNSIVAKGQIVNRSVPTRRRSASVEITVATEIPSERVLGLLRQATMLVPELLETPKPLLTLRRSGLTSATYAATFFVADSPALIAARSNLLRQMRRLLYHAGIVPPQAIAPVDILRAVSLFEPLSADELAELAGDLVTHPLDIGTVLFEQGSPGTSIYIVGSGVLEIARKTPTTDSKALGRIGPGEYIGELGLITGAVRGVTMTALTVGTVLELPGESLTELLRSNAALATAMERSVRRGLDLLDRDEAARAAQPDQHGPALFARIRGFFAAISRK
jgi:small-conductance mechanosensitive channel/CRP-like cAMP-binding protein